MEWQKELKQNAKTAQDLVKFLPLSDEEQQQMTAVLEKFPMSITQYYLSLIDFTDKNDPILKMAVPSIKETDLSGSFDTSGEAGNTVIEGLQHKYAETAMMLSTNECAMYCRHCFRKRLVGLSEDEIASRFDAMRDYITQHTEIRNVLVSGGDALLNSNERLKTILSMLADIPHLDNIRIASRVPVVFPSRITGDDELLALLAETNAKKQLFFVTQFNHPKEITPEAAAAVKAILSLGIPVRNQAVLLRGINDDGQTLGTLLRRLISIGAEPYYVFQCRPVSGVKNQFQVPLKQGYHIVEEAKAMQSGLGKAFRYCLSHVSGKIEILGEVHGGQMVFKYHEAKNTADLGRIFTAPLDDGQAWLEQDEYR